MNSHRVAARIGAVLWLLVAWVPAARGRRRGARPGRYLATVANCVSCHTRPGGVAYAGGLPFVTDFGTLHSTNITSDPNVGIGRWSLEQFTRAMREGVDDEGRHLYPAFP
jgi:mono/diheme cytochrome c family protein